jgi:hypothetical protein
VTFLHLATEILRNVHVQSLAVCIRSHLTFQVTGVGEGISHLPPLNVLTPVHSGDDAQNYVNSHFPAFSLVIYIMSTLLQTLEKICQYFKTSVIALLHFRCFFYSTFHVDVKIQLDFLYLHHILSYIYH